MDSSLHRTCTSLFTPNFYCSLQQSTPTRIPLASSRSTARSISISSQSPWESVELNRDHTSSILLWVDPPVSPASLTPDPFFRDESEKGCIDYSADVDRGAEVGEMHGISRENEGKGEIEEDGSRSEKSHTPNSSYVAMPWVGMNLNLWRTRMHNREIRRAGKWESMAGHSLDEGFQAHSFLFPTQLSMQKFVSRVYKGIPNCWRAEAWWNMVVQDESEDAEIALFGTYHMLLRFPSCHEHEIELDILRECKRQYEDPQKVHRNEQRDITQSLTRILKSFSNFDPEIGYCRGISSIVCVLLFYYDEERAFAMLTHLFRKYDLHHLLIPGFPVLIEGYYVFERLLKIHLPRVANRLSELNITPSAYTTRWFITIFAGVVPHSTLLRVWDVFMLEGFDVLFFVAVALLKLRYLRLMRIRNSEAMLEFLGSQFLARSYEEDRLMRWVRKMYEKAKAEKTVRLLRRDYRYGS
ncbi:uncharacterized protein VTP21DRAFT_3139 [Calcarisporiella thermophila]|uniref:uncharacterized protein n=1 Tax=Calcarisporiella thermophila TaxID=911321 RepID=UPI003742B6C5